MQKKRSFEYKTKLERSHSDHCIRKENVLIAEKNIVDYKFSVLKEELLLKETLDRNINNFEILLKNVMDDYQSVMKRNVCDRSDHDDCDSLTCGIDFSAGKKIKLYETNIEIIQNKLNNLKYVYELMELYNKDNEFIKCSADLEKSKEVLLDNSDSPYCKNKLHSFCKCPNVIMSHDNEECSICFEDDVKLFDTKCDNKHMLCYSCISKIIDDDKDNKLTCPFCRNTSHISTATFEYMKKNCK